MTLDELITKFRGEASDDVAPYFFSDLDITQWLNEAVDEAAIRSRLLYDEDAIAVVAGTHTYPTDPVVVDVTKAFFTPTGGSVTELHIVDRDELGRLMRDWRTSTADPAYLVQDDTTVRIVPTPTVDGELLIEFYRTQLVAMSDGNNVPEIAAQHHRHLVHWALHQGFKRPDSETMDPKRSEAADTEFSRNFGLRQTANRRRATNANQPHFNKSFLI